MKRVLLLLEAVLPKHKTIQLTLMYKIPQATQASIGKAKDQRILSSTFFKVRIKVVIYILQ